MARWLAVAAIRAAAVCTGIIALTNALSTEFACSREVWLPQANDAVPAPGGRLAPEPQPAARSAAEATTVAVKAAAMDLDRWLSFMLGANA